MLAEPSTGSARSLERRDRRGSAPLSVTVLWTSTTLRPLVDGRPSAVRSHDVSQDGDVLVPVVSELVESGGQVLTCVLALATQIDPGVP